MRPIKIINNYVFVVTEDATEEHPDGWIHGVYINWNEANGKFNSLLDKEYPGLSLGNSYYQDPRSTGFHLLKLPVHGKNVNGTLGQFLRA